MIVLNKNILSSALAIVGRAVPGKSTMQILQGVLIQKNGGSVTLCSNNLEMAITATIQADAGMQTDTGEDFAAVFPAEFLNIAKQLPGDTLSVEMDNLHAKVISGDARFYLNCMDAEQFPVPVKRDALPEPNVVVPGALLKTLTAKTAFCASLDASRDMFQGILLEGVGAKLSCRASDTHRVAICTAENTQAGGKKFRALIPAKLLLEVARGAADDDKVEVYLSTEAVFAAGDYVFSLRQLNGKYPDFSNAFPAEPQTRIKVDRAQFTAMLSRAMLLTEGGHKVVRLSAGGDTLSVKATSETGGMDESIPAEINGEELETVAFNGKYLLEGLKALDGDTVNLELNGEFGPAVMHEDSSDGDAKQTWKYLVLPIKHSEGA